MYFVLWYISFGEYHCYLFICYLFILYIFFGVGEDRFHISFPSTIELIMLQCNCNWIYSQGITFMIVAQCNCLTSEHMNHILLMQYKMVGIIEGVWLVNCPRIIFWYIAQLWNIPAFEENDSSVYLNTCALLIIIMGCSIVDCVLANNGMGVTHWWSTCRFRGV